MCILFVPFLPRVSNILYISIVKIEKSPSNYPQKSPIINIIINNDIKQRTNI